MIHSSFQALLEVCRARARRQTGLGTNLEGHLSLAVNFWQAS